MYEQIARNYRALYRAKYGVETTLTDQVIIDIWEGCRGFDDQDNEVLDDMHRRTLIDEAEGDRYAADFEAEMKRRKS